MTRTLLVLLSAFALTSTGVSRADTDSATEPALQEWEVEWGGRTRDPYVAPDGKVWFVGQAGNYVATFDPDTLAFRRYEIEDGTNPHTVIVDDDGPTINVANVTANEGNSGTTPFTFTVSLSAASPQTVRVGYTTANGSATAGQVYTSLSGSLTFAAGETVRSVVIDVSGDTRFEIDETFTLNLAARAGLRA